MDESRALVAGQLIALAPRLAAEIPGLRMLVVGGGDVYDEMLEKSRAANAEIGRECVTMTGGRTDINEFVAVADVFVGVSRSALEAMAAEKTVVVAGNEGYIGIFTPDKLETAQENNFCCRGCEMSSEELLFHDVTYAFHKMTPEGQRCRGRQGNMAGRLYLNIIPSAKWRRIV